MSENICVINAQSGIGTSSPQISQFSHNCDCIKFIINKNLTGFALCLISSINGDVSVLTEGEYLSKTYDDETKQTSVLWYPDRQITNESGCVLYQLAAYEAEGKNTIWYSKEGRLIVSDSIDTNDFSAKQVGSEPNLITQLITKIKSLELDITSLESTKFDKEDADEEKEKLEKLNSNFDETKENFEERFELAEADIKNLSDVVEENKGEETYNPESIKSQSGKAVAQALADLVNSAPETLDTLDELAKALGNDPNFATTIMTLLGKKVDKIEGKVLSSNDFTDGEKQDLADAIVDIQNLEDNKADNSSVETIKNELIRSIDNKVDKLSGKGLSSNDFTNTYKQMLDNFIGDEGIINLGTFYWNFGGGIEDNENFIEAVDNAMATGIYKLKLLNSESELSVDMIMLVVNSDMDSTFQVLFTPLSLGFPTKDLRFPLFRTYYFSKDTNEEVWSSWTDGFSEKVDKDIVTDNSDDVWEEYSNKLIPAASVLVDFVPERRVVYSVDEIEDGYMEIPNVETTLGLINPPPITTIPTTLSPNKQYNFGEVTSLNLTFPTYADDGDVIYLTFYSGATETSLTIDTTNTCDIEFVPEKNTGYEVFGKFNGSIWIVNYSEYMVSEG